LLALVTLALKSFIEWRLRDKHEEYREQGS